MRFSYLMLPDYPLSDSIEVIKTADRLGFYAVYSVDETWHKDWAVLFAAAADKTERVRFGPNVTHVFLREPTLIVQQLATLDELTNGRIEAVVSTGNFGLMHQYGIDWAKRKPLSRLKEALHVMRTFLDDGKIDFQGDFFQYSGLFTAARPVQERMPLLMGAHEGAALVHRGGRARRRHAPRALLLARGVRLRGRERAQGRRQGRPQLRRPRHRRLGRDRRGRGLGGGQARGADPRRVLHLLDARGAARAPRDRARGGPAGGRRARRGRRRGRDREVHARAGRAAVGRRHAGGVRREDQARHRAGRRQPHDPRAHRRPPRRVLLAARRWRTCRASTTSSSSSPSG